ncbi:MAG: FAD-binding oxidoreductase [Mesorhizobium sp.]|uniref:FAD-binding oxidoreductase n=1 Tax=Mesorhizobium sp. TaxID=1871066 RepID=UPI000FE694DD|nr:FAD-binding oxidoreductase [Mesorhizobium sp.]RWP82093.1 MAG: FAD-binding oxidoreductase [Mesorhizobium sp.]TIM21895.1 MAG: FAD-binding oxidoreductase [Mesorhizobium sp.]
MSKTSHAQIEQLKQLLGDGGVLTGNDCLPYESGARFDVGKAAFVLRPATVSELSAAVSFCVRSSISIIPQSANTGVVAGSTPDPSGTQAVVSLERLRNRFEIDTENRSVHLDAGFRLSEVNARLEQHGLFFPIDLGADPLVGGMIATNTGGARLIRYGDVRRNTLGLTVVFADENGSVVKLGSSLRKSNVGVDWKQLFIGTCGVFGIVAECVLNLEPVPQQVATALLVPKSLDAVLPLLDLIERRAGPSLSAFEGMSGNAIAAALAHVPRLKNPFSRRDHPEYAILVEISRSWEAQSEMPIDEQLQTMLSELWESNNELLEDVLFGPSHELWALRHAISEGVKAVGKLVALDIAFKRGDVMRFLKRMRTELPAAFPGVQICEFGHIGDGGVHFNLVVDRDSANAADPDYERRIRSLVYNIVVNEYGGSFSAEHNIGRKNQAYYDLFTDDSLKKLSAALKRSTSPSILGVPVLW